MAFVYIFALLCCLVPFSTNAFVVKGAHYIELDLVIENCVSNSVHFNVSISHLNNDSDVIMTASLDCTTIPSFWTNESSLNVYAGRSARQYIATTLLHSVIQIANDTTRYTNNTFIFYGNESKVSFWNRNNDIDLTAVSPSIDNALIFLSNQLPDNLSISGLSDLCYKCKYYPIISDAYILPMQTVAFEVDTRFLYTLKITRRFFSNHSERNIFLPYHYEEQAHYEIFITQSYKAPEIMQRKSPYNTYLRLYQFVAAHELVPMLSFVSSLIQRHFELPLYIRLLLHKIQPTPLKMVTYLTQLTGGIYYSAYSLIINGAIFVVLASIFTFFSLLSKYMNKKKICMLPSIEKLINNELGGGTGQQLEQITSRDINDTSQKKEVSPSEEKPLFKSQKNDGKAKVAFEGKKERLNSLDTFRGLSLCIMIFVKYGGGGYWFFNHSTWNGLTVADLVFPWFMWIMGVSMVYSFRGRAADSKISFYYQIVRRSVILFVLGVLFVNNCYDLSTCRVPGVLQRFAITYFVCASIEFLFLSVYKIKCLVALAKRVPNFVIELYYSSFQWVIMIIFEIIWVAITFGLQFDNCPRGYIGPGGISDDGNYSNCTGGAAYYIDKQFFGIEHIYSSPKSKEVYKTGPYDPEGILGSINSIVLCYFGVYAGKVLLYHKGHLDRIIRWLIWGIATGVGALFLCQARQNDGWIPINKNLWSFSFILALTSTAFILLAVLYILIDLTKIWNGAPFRYVGLNSILIFMGSVVFKFYFPFKWKGSNVNHAMFLLSNEVGVSAWIAIALYCHSIKFYIKI